MVEHNKTFKELYPFKSNYIKIKDYNYHYIDEGEGPVILMLHGNPTWSFYYRELIKEFSKNYRVIAPDHLGCGLSDKPQDYPYKLDSHIDNVEKLVLSLKIKKLILLVHDWGGAIGMGFAVRHPKNISSLIILNSSAFSLHRIPFRINILRTPVLGEFMIRGLNLFCLAATCMTTTKKMPKDVIDGYLKPYNSYKNRIAVSRFVEDIPMEPEDQSYELLIEIERSLWLMRENPVCIIWGMKDWCFNTAFLKRWKIYYPQADVLELDEAGHYVLEDGKDEAINYIHEFLEKYNL